MLKEVARTIRKFNMISSGQRIIVGLSGGADSVSLLSALISLRDELKIELFAAHINHNLRGQASDNDEAFVRALCKTWDMPLHVYQADVKGHAAAEKLGIEEAARNLRYKYLNQAFIKCSADKIAVGHNQDDNAETVLLNLFRGAGLRGLCGIPPISSRIIRPLLTISRDKIETYAQENNLQYITDQTNASTDYTRNHLRNKVIPDIKEHFGQHISKTIANNALELRADEEYISSEAIKAMPLFANIKSDSEPLSELTIPIHELKHLPEALSRRVLREGVSHLRGGLGLQDIQSTHIQAILDIAQGQTGRMADLPGIKARREYENLVLSANSKPEPTGFTYPITIDTPLFVQELNKTIKLTLQPQKHYTQAFNYDNVKGLLELRTRRPGDKITLAGVGTKKLQDYFTDTKTPQKLRDQVPLLADGSNIIWIMDKANRINAAYQPTGDSEDSKTCWAILMDKGM